MGDTPDRVVVTTTTGWGSRIGGAFLGAVVGLLLAIGGVLLLTWNEGRAVTAATALADGARTAAAAAADSLDPALDGRLVHVTGPLTATRPARDAAFAVGGDRTLRLRRTVEMYQWQETSSSKSERNVGGSETTETVYEYRRDWSEHPIDSAQFQRPEGHRNPPMALRSADMDGEVLLAARRRLSPGLLEQLGDFQPIAIADGHPAPAGMRAAEGGFYRGGDPESPQVGDLRIRFAEVTEQEVSVVARQQGDRLLPFTGAGGYEIALLSPGSVEAAEMFRAAAAGEALLTWILRVAGFVLMLIGFALLFRPLAVLVGVLPFLESLVGAGSFLVALACALPLTLATIAVAWLAHRPLVAVPLLLAAAGLGWFLWRRTRRAAGAAA